MARNLFLLARGGGGYGAGRGFWVGPDLHHPPFYSDLVFTKFCSISRTSPFLLPTPDLLMATGTHGFGSGTSHVASPVDDKPVPPSTVIICICIG